MSTVQIYTADQAAELLGCSVKTVTVRTEHLVEEIRPCDSGALVTLRHADGAGQLRACFNAYGQCWGGFGGLDVLADAPHQRHLPEVTA